MNRNYPMFRGITFIVSIVIGLLLIAGGYFVWFQNRAIGAVLIVTGIIFIGVFLFYSFARRSSE